MKWSLSLSAINKSIQALKNLKSNNIRSIISDKFGNIVFASNEGIQIYVSQAGGFETFGEERGVAYLEPNLNGISSDSTGAIWISENNGIIKYNPVFVNLQDTKPKISISKKLLFFNLFEKNKHKFRFNQNHLTFEYTGIWFQSIDNLIYRYKLENYDFDWSLPTHSHIITYSNLPPGYFVFKVEVSHKLGTWVSSKDAEFTFKIRPPFYRTWWFILIAISSIISTMFLYLALSVALISTIGPTLSSFFSSLILLVKLSLEIATFPFVTLLFRLSISLNKILLRFKRILRIPSLL